MLQSTLEAETTSTIQLNRRNNMGDHRKSNSEVRKRKAADQFIRTAANKIRKL
jgi:hypothetical protein